MDQKIKTLIKQIVELERFSKDTAILDNDDPYDKLQEMYAKIRELAEYIITSERLLDVEQKYQNPEECISLHELLADLSMIKQRVLYELILVAIQKNNISYAITLLDTQGSISLFQAQAAMKFNRLNCLLQIIRHQINQKIIPLDHLEDLLEMILMNKNAIVVAEAIMAEFPELSSDTWLMKKYISVGNIDLLNQFMDTHHKNIYAMNQTIQHVVQEVALEINFNIANILFKKGIDVWSYKLKYLESKLSKARSLLEISQLNFEVAHVRHGQHAFWQKVLMNDSIDQITAMLRDTKPNDKVLIKILINLVIVHAENFLTKAEDNYLKFFDAIQKIYPDGNFDLEYASFLILMNEKTRLALLLEKHQDETSKTQLTFIEEIQLLAFKKNQINIAEELEQRFSVNAPAKKIKLLESSLSEYYPKKDEELKELRRYQQAQLQRKPSMFSNVMQLFAHPLFSSPSSPELNEEIGIKAKPRI